MILERKTQINIPELTDQHSLLFQQFQDSEYDTGRASLMILAELMQMYSAAMKGISTKLEVLDDEFQVIHRHNPIHHIECRIKGFSSIYQKMLRNGIPLSLDSARENIQDIAGIRVVCNFIDDVYTMETLLLKQSDVTLIQRKDYIAQPKETGYRSLHLVVMTPIHLSSRAEEIPVEIQLRTIAMDYWASLEHMLRYKNNGDNMEKYYAMLLDCSDKLAETENTMQFIHNKIL